MFKKFAAMAMAGVMTIGTLAASGVGAVPVMADSGYGWDDFCTDLAGLYALDQAMGSYGYGGSDLDILLGLGLLYGMGEALEEASVPEAKQLDPIQFTAEQIDFEAEKWTDKSRGFEFYIPESWEEQELTDESVKNGAYWAAGGVTGDDEAGMLWLYSKRMPQKYNLNQIAYELSTDSEFNVKGVRRNNDLDMVEYTTTVQGIPAYGLCFLSPDDPKTIVNVVGTYTEGMWEVMRQVLCSFKTV